MSFRVSIFLMAYRMEGTILQALEGALAQTVPCEIFVSDDCSGDRSLELASARVAQYSGHHRVIVRSNERNVGLCAHIDTLFRLAQGEIFVFMAADDVSHPFRVAELLKVFEAYPDVYAAGSAVDEIDMEGRLLRRGVWYLDSPMDQSRFLHCGRFATLLGASMAIRRELLVGLPPLQGMVEDNMLTLRATLFGRVYCLRQPLLQYRRHAANLGNWVYSRENNVHGARRQRYERTVRMYREIADDHERCLAALPHLDDQRRMLASRIVSMYRIEAEAREAILKLPKRQWLHPIYRGMTHPGLRRKSWERAFKLLVPRRWLGL